MPRTVLFVDIDNTLYDWASFYAPSFRAMMHAVARELAAPEDRLYDEAKKVFARHGSLEYAFVIQELESVKSTDVERLRDVVEAGRGAFRSVQKKRLAPYPGVTETLKWLNEQDVMVVGITNSPVYQAQLRLYDLRLDSLLYGLVAWEGFEASSNDAANEGFVPSGRTRKLSRLKEEQVWTLPEGQCKPNERHYLRGLEALSSRATDAWAIGDSLAKDLEPAARLGIKTIWARYGAGFDATDRDMATLLRITHWDSSRIHATYKQDDFKPDVVVDTFEELQRIIPAKYLSLF